MSYLQTDVLKSGKETGDAPVDQLNCLELRAQGEFQAVKNSKENKITEL
jgi:hypothetical protein